MVDHYGPINRGTYACDISQATVNDKSRVNYSHNKKVRLANDPKYDLLFSTDKKTLVPYDPAKHGVWEIRKNASGKCYVTSQEDGSTMSYLSCTLTIQGKQFTFTTEDVNQAFKETSEADWRDNPGREAYTHVVVGGESKPIKSVFRKLPTVPAGFDFSTHDAVRAFKRLGFEIKDIRGADANQQLSLIGTWGGNFNQELKLVENGVNLKGGWASWWSFPIEEEAQTKLITPFYFYINRGGGNFPYRMKVEKFVSKRGNNGISSPWPAITEAQWLNKTRIGSKQSEVFKTWLMISEIEKLNSPLTLNDMTLAVPFSHPKNVLNQNRFGYVYVNEENRVASKAGEKNYWWLNYNSKHWDLAKLPIGHREIFTSHNEDGEKRQKFLNFEQVRNGDTVIAYEASPQKRVTSLMEITNELGDTPEGPGIEVQLIERFSFNPDWETLKKDSRLENCESFRSNNRGTLFKLTKSEYLAIRDIIDEKGAREEAFLERYSIKDALAEVFVDKEDFEDILDLLRYKKNIILQGPPGVGKTFIAKKLAYAMMGVVDKKRVEMIQFHQSYSYEDFIQGYRPNDDGGFSLKNGIFFDFCRCAQEDPERDYFFIIDEINRGNLSKIFGELLMLIEADKRGANFDVPLTYSRSAKDRFSVPENLHIIGTMNTADRSLAMVDFALRRRFSFIDLKPCFEEKFVEYLTREGVKADLTQKIVDRVSSLNSDIRGDNKNLGAGFCIGHSFFCPNGSKSQHDVEWYRMVVKREIAPLLKEYWFDDEDKAERKILALLSD